MKATGIVRRVDDLGRIVIPKEIRRTLRIREGEPLEIFLDEKQKMICFQKYLDNESQEKINQLKNSFLQLSEEERQEFLSEINI